MTAIVEASDLRKSFRIGRALIHAVDGISFHIEAGETLALVGESGCGKTTTAELLLRLQKPTGGEIRFKGQPILRLHSNALRALRRDLQVVFQNPRSSLNPRLRIREVLAEPLRLRDDVPDDVSAEIARVLALVQLGPQIEGRFPHEVSGGQAQRVAIARALAMNPKVIVLDEPTSALDVSVQAQIINLLKDLQATLGLTYLFISHDLRIVRHLSDRVAIMYLGRIVETGPTAAIFNAPRHPYTKALISAVPRAHPRLRRDRIVLGGDIPSPAAIPSGCRFSTRCPSAQGICAVQDPPETIVSDVRRYACHFPET